MRFLEISIGKKLICILHSNEPLLRQLINKLDSSTILNNFFLDSIGKLLLSTADLPIDKEFTLITIESPLIKLA